MISQKVSRSDFTDSFIEGLSQSCAAFIVAACTLTRDSETEDGDQLLITVSPDLPVEAKANTTSNLCTLVVTVERLDEKTAGAAMTSEDARGTNRGS